MKTKDIILDVTFSKATHEGWCIGIMSINETKEVYRVKTNDGYESCIYEDPSVVGQHYRNVKNNSTKERKVELQKHKLDKWETVETNG